MPLLEVEDVRKIFRRPGQPDVHALDGVSLEVDAQEAVGLIGESGSGKSTLARLVLGLTKPDSGRIVFDGSAIEALSSRALRAFRSRMQLVFQEPLESLNPRMKVGSIVEEPLLVHRQDLSRRDRRTAALRTLEEVGLPQAYMDRYPRELSGGQQQRVGIARAIVTRPSLVVLDEPTASLDLSVRAVILRLLQELKAELGLSYLLISHDIDTVGYFCDRTVVIYRGRLVETGVTSDVVDFPLHPYTQALLSSTLSIDADASPEPMRLAGELGEEDGRPPEGCVLCGRCPIEIRACSAAQPHLATARSRSGHRVACIRAGADASGAPSQTAASAGQPSVLGGADAGGA